MPAGRHAGARSHCHVVPHLRSMAWRVRWPPPQSSEDRALVGPNLEPLDEATVVIENDILLAGWSVLRYQNTRWRRTRRRNGLHADSWIPRLSRPYRHGRARRCSKGWRDNRARSRLAPARHLVAVEPVEGRALARSGDSRRRPDAHRSGGLPAAPRMGTQRYGQSDSFDGRSRRSGRRAGGFGRLRHQGRAERTRWPDPRCEPHWRRSSRQHTSVVFGSRAMSTG